MDPIIVPNDFTAYDSGVLFTPNDITDHSATYIVLPHDYSFSSANTRRVWFFKRTDFTQLEKSINLFNLECLSEGFEKDCCTLFTSKFMEFVNQCIPHKDVTIRPYSKPWYDSEIR